MSQRAKSKTAEYPAGASVYFLLAESARVVKIGHSNDTPKRLAALRASSPIPLTLVGQIEGGRLVESWCHMHCYADRSHFEWFHWTPRVVTFIDLILSHGWGAAQIFCKKAWRDDNAAYWGEPRKLTAFQLPRSDVKYADPPVTGSYDVCRCLTCLRRRGEIR